MKNNNNCAISRAIIFYSVNKSIQNPCRQINVKKPNPDHSQTVCQVWTISLLLASKF